MVLGSHLPNGLFGIFPSKFIHMRRFAYLVTAVVFIGACGGSGVSSPPATFPEGATVVRAISGLRLDAKQYTAQAGEVTIGYANDDSMRHTLIISKDSTKVPNFKLVVNNKNDTDSATVTLTAGTYTVVCDIPGHSNMKATIVVQ